MYQKIVFLLLVFGTRIAAQTGPSVCRVSLYEDKNYVTPLATFASASTTGDVFDNFPKKMSSIKLSDWCESVKLFDDDPTGSKNDVVYTESQAELPFDLDNDVKIIEIKKIIERPPPARIDLDLNVCKVRLYEDRNYEKPLAAFATVSTTGEVFQGFEPKMASFDMSLGCKSVKLFDDDDASTRQDVVFTRSQAALSFDLKNDVKKIEITAKTPKITSTSTAATTKPGTSTTTKKTKKTNPSPKPVTTKPSASTAAATNPDIPAKSAIADPGSFAAINGGVIVLLMTIMRFS